MHGVHQCAGLGAVYEQGVLSLFIAETDKVELVRGENHIPGHLQEGCTGREKCET